MIKKNTIAALIKQYIPVRVIFVLCAICLPGFLWAEGAHAQYQSATGIVLLGLASILCIALLADTACNKWKCPPVLGELFAGVLLGNLGAWLGWDLMTLLREGSAIVNMIHDVLGGVISWEDSAEHRLGNGHVESIVTILTGIGGHAHAFAAQIIEAISFLGAIALLFVVGLEHSPREMIKGGGRSLAVALVGIVAPLIGVWAACSLFSVSDLSAEVLNGGWKVHLFIAAILTATSVGITARIFKDAGQIQRPEAKLILGAAVIDDILAVALLAIVLSLIGDSSSPFADAAYVLIKATAFLGIMLVLGPWFTNKVTRILNHQSGRGAKELFALVLCFSASWAAESLGLAAIVGAFIAGLILNDLPSRQDADSKSERHEYELVLEPIQAFLTPVFFVIIGIQVKLESLIASPTIIMLAVILSVIAWYGKQLCGLVAGAGQDRLLVGIGMVPRGEVGLIFAALGKQLGILDDAGLAMVIMVIMITTIIAPMALSRRLKKLSTV